VSQQKQVKQRTEAWVLEATQNWCLQSLLGVNKTW